MSLHNTRKRRSAVIWGLRCLLAVVFILAGGQKLAGTERMLEMFAAIGFGGWFRIFTGTVEVIAASCLLVPALSRFGALLIVATMTGAVFTHILLIGGTFLPAMTLGGIALLLLLNPPQSRETAHV